MKKYKLSKIITTMLVALVLLGIHPYIYAAEKIETRELEYTDQYKEWLELPEEKRKDTIPPTKYKIETATATKERTSVIRFASLLKSTAATEYSLQSVIPENLTIRNQRNTNSCWAFAALSSLETNLALKDYRAKKTTKTVYDFSERHMEYATSRVFKDGKINPLGFNRKVGEGGGTFYSIPYLTNGSGAILETDMPFENNEDMIDIKEIQNKTVAARVLDQNIYDAPAVEEGKDRIKAQIKNHIMEYGAVDVGIYGASAFDTTYYNQETGALYCSNSFLCPANHEVTIVGWNDKYSKENFNEGHRPTSDGAWIVRNSWGVELEYGTVEQLRSDLAEQFPDKWATKEDVPDTAVQQVLDYYGWTIEDGVVKCGSYGDQGFIYISYEDVNIYKTVSGITNAQTTIDYDYLYQHDEFGSVGGIYIYSNKAYLANVFQKQSNGVEALNSISIYTYATYDCKVYVNPKGTSKAKSDLVEAKLKKGSTATIDPGYHTIEFAEPVYITGNNFVVVVEVATSESRIPVALECKDDYNPEWDVVTAGKNESFYTIESQFNSNTWTDVAEAYDANLCIKAFTVESTLPEEPSTPSTPEEPTTPTDPTKPEEPTTPSTPEEPSTPSTPEDPTTPDNPTAPSKAEPSDFSKATVHLNKADVYLYTKEAQNSYFTMEFQIDNIKATDGQTYEHYFYLSANKNETVNSIASSMWSKVKEFKKNQEGTYSIIFEINSTTLPNYNEIADADEIYVYIKETAKNGTGTSAVATTGVSDALAISNDTESAEMNFYLDGQKKTAEEVGEYLTSLLTPSGENGSGSGGGSSSGGSSSSGGTKTYSASSDKTVASGRIPQTGISGTILVCMAIIIVVAGISYYRYKHIDQ